MDPDGKLWFKKSSRAVLGRQASRKEVTVRKGVSLSIQFKNKGIVTGE